MRPVVTVAALLALAIAPAAARAYHPIVPTRSDTIVLTGKTLTVEQVVAIARDGARVRLSDAATRRSADAYGLLIEAAAEGVPVYWFNRGDGANRQVDIFTGDPLAPANEAMLTARELAIFKRGAAAGFPPEVDSEEIVRATMAIRANTMSFEAASPQLTAMLVALLNDRVTPVVYARGSVGEGDLVPLGNIGATMVGAGDAYFRGKRMRAADALQEAGLAPLRPGVADDSALTPTNAYTAAIATLAVYDAKRALEWADIAYAMDLLGMNSSLTPIASGVQANRPVPSIVAEAARISELLRGSYLYDADPDRIIQDPESLRASAQRQGAAWDAWSRLHASLLLQINSSDHNPAVLVGASPSDSWDMRTPQMMQFYVKGGPRSHGQHGYVLSDANWDPYPLANDIEAFSLALANMDVAVSQRVRRFKSRFFTVVAAGDVLGPIAYPPLQDYSDYLSGDLEHQVNVAAEPVHPTGQALIGDVEDLQGEGALKASHARAMVDATDGLLALDLLNGAYWMDVRAKQVPSRAFGAVPTAVWHALRAVVPLDSGTALPPRPNGVTALSFMRAHPASEFLAGRSR
ncbi:MAG TPA: aromatic amino acid ammonia-lyase [Candidatus Baltobacteraceae bacterium]|jgi:histidine ammonia-lyase